MVEFEAEEIDDVDVPQDAAQVLETLEQVEARMQELKEERKRLFEANRRLVELVEHLENELEAFVDTDEVDNLSVEGYEYSFKEGWRSQEEGREARMELEPDVDADGIENQIREVRGSIKRLEEHEK